MLAAKPDLAETDLPRPAPPRARRLAPARALSYNLLSLAAGLLVWHLAAIWISSPFFPGPVKILDAFIRLASAGDTMGNSLWAHSWASLHRVMVGFGFAVLLGVPLGLAMGLNTPLYTSTRSIIEPFRFIPPIAWIPLAIIFFSGLPRFAFLIFLGAFFPIYTATHVGVSRVEREKVAEIIAKKMGDPKALPVVTTALGSVILTEPRVDMASTRILMQTIAKQGKIPEDRAKDVDAWMAKYIDYSFLDRAEKSLNLAK